MKAGASFRPYRVEVTGTLKCLGPMHIGSGEAGSHLTDAPLLRMNRSPYLPGSSIRGVIRDHLEREAGLLGCTMVHLDRLFGRAVEKGGSGIGALGRLTVCDSYTVSELTAGGASTEVRDHVRINKKWGAAEDGAQFDMEALLPNDDLAFSLQLIYEGEGIGDPEYLLFVEAVKFLQSDRVRLGAKSGWGFGRVNLDNVKVRQFARDSDAGLANYLQSRAGKVASPVGELASLPEPMAKPSEGAGSRILPWAYLHMVLKFDFEGPVLIKSSLPPISEILDQSDESLRKRAKDRSNYSKSGEAAADMVFVRRANDDAYFFPGSSLRGVLRSQASKICHTMFGNPASNPVDILFGSLKSGKTGSKTLIEVEDAILADGKSAKPVYFDHVAIDRIVNCAEDGAKFATSALVSPSFLTRVSVRFGDKPEHRAALALWGFLLKDLLNGRLWAGHGTARGYGYIASGAIVDVKLDAPTRMKFVGTDAPSEETPPGTGVWSASTSLGRSMIRYGGKKTLGFCDLSWIWREVEKAWKDLLPVGGKDEEGE